MSAFTSKSRVACEAMRMYACEAIKSEGRYSINESVAFFLFQCLCLRLQESCRTYFFRYWNVCKAMRMYVCEAMRMLEV